MKNNTTQRNDLNATSFQAFSSAQLFSKFLPPNPSKTRGLLILPESVSVPAWSGAAPPATGEAAVTAQPRGGEAHRPLPRCNRTSGLGFCPMYSKISWL